jgi:hypothetical protein
VSHGSKAPTVAAIIYHAPQLSLFRVTLPYLYSPQGRPCLAGVTLSIPLARQHKVGVSLLLTKPMLLSSLYPSSHGSLMALGAPFGYPTVAFCLVCCGITFRANRLIGGLVLSPQGGNPIESSSGPSLRRIFSRDSTNPSNPCPSAYTSSLLDKIPPIRRPSRPSHPHSAHQLYILPSLSNA